MADLIIDNSYESIKNKIFTLRETQVMLDDDLAKLYHVNIKQLNRAVKRNAERFPINFMFQLTNEELECLRCQFGTLKEGRGKHRKYLPYVFTEQGVSMLSGVLRSDTAIKVSIQIINTFISMRKFILKNGELFNRLDYIEKKQVKFEVQTEENFEKIFEAIEEKTLHKKQGIFFDGQIFDAYKFISDLIRTANTSITLIDNYIDDSVLSVFSKKNKSVKVTIYTKNISKQLKLDLEKYNSQYDPIEIKEFNNSHDRFMIIDNKEVYHFGASLKDLGKKWFAFSKFEKDALNILEKLK